jgi:hypothetical protein
VDANHTAIVKAVTQCGARVLDLSRLGQGVPDLLIAYRGQLCLWELKDGDKPPSKRRLTPAEQAWHEHWQGAPVLIINSVDEAIDALNAMGS